MINDLKIIFEHKALIPFFLILFIGLYYLTKLAYYNALNINAQLRKILIIIRLSIWGLLLLALINPLLKYFFYQNIRNKCLILIDNSLSMNVIDKNKKSRMEKAQQFIQSDTLDYLHRHFEMNYFLFDSHFIPVTKNHVVQIKQADGDASDLGNSLLNTTLLQDKGIQGVILLSDGINNIYNDMPIILKQVRKKGIKVFPLDLCQEENIKDIALNNILYPEEANINAEINLEVKINSLNYDNTTILLKTLLNDKIIETKRIKINRGMNSFKTSIFLKKNGINKITFMSEKKEDEVIDLNNSRTIFIRTLKNKFKVLFIYGQPSFEYKFIKLALNTDPNIILDAYLKQQNNLGQIHDLKKYDLIMIGDIKFQDLPENLVQNILYYAQNKIGALLFLGGRNSFRNGDYHVSKLKDIIPVKWNDTGEILKSDFTLKLTPSGLSTPFMRLMDDVNGLQDYWASLPPLNLINVVRSVKEGTHIIAVDSKQENLIVLAIGQYLQTKVGIFTGYPSWKWGFINLGFGQRDNPFNIFWQQLVRYLINYNLEKINLFTNKLIYKKDEDIFIKLFLYDNNYKPIKLKQVEVQLLKNVNNQYKTLDTVILSPSSSSAGLYEAIMNLKEYGEYKLEANLKNYQYKADTFFLIKNPEIELYELVQNKALLQDIALQTGGRFLKYKEGKELTKLIEPKVIKEKVNQVKNIWDNWIYLILFIGLLTTEWYIRKRNGLL